MINQPVKLDKFFDKRFLHYDAVLDAHFIPNDCILSTTGNRLYVWDSAGIKITDFDLSGKNQNNDKIILDINDPSYFAIGPMYPSEIIALQIFHYQDNHIEKLKEISYDFDVDQSYHITFCIAGEKLLIGSAEGIEIIEWKTDKSINKITTPFYKSPETHVCFSSDGQLGLFALEERVCIVNINNGKKLSKFKVDRLEKETAPVFSGDNNLLALAGKSMAATDINIYDTNKKEIISRETHYASNGYVLHMAFSHNNEYLLQSLAGVDLVCWNIKEERIQWIKRRSDYTGIASFNSNNEQVLFLQGNRIYLLNSITGEPLINYRGTNRNISDLYYDAETDTLVISDRGSIYLLHQSLNEIVTLMGQPLAVLEGKVFIKERIMSIISCYDLKKQQRIPLLEKQFSHVYISNSYIILSNFYENDLLLEFYSHKGRPVFSITVPVEQFDLSKDETMLIGVKGSEIILFDLKTKQEIKHLDVKEDGDDDNWISRIIFSYDSKKFAIFYNKKIIVFSIEKDKPIMLFPLEQENLIHWQITEDNGLILWMESGHVYEIDMLAEEKALLIKLCFELSSGVFPSRERMFLAAKNTSIWYLDLIEAQSDQKNDPNQESGEFFDWNNSKKIKLSDIKEVLENAEWNSFNAEVDFIKLRNILMQLEEKRGVGDVHYFCTQKLKERGMRLNHRFGHIEPISSFSLSPDRRYLATGSWVGGDYDRGGSLVIWEVETGCCMNILNPIEGGVGWPDEGECIQWSPDSKQIGSSFNTNAVGNWLPFEDTHIPLTTISVTNGWDSAPAWTWSPESKEISISCWGPSAIPGCISKLNQVYIAEYDARWFAKEMDKEIRENMDDNELQPFTWFHWSNDGRLMYGYNNHGQMYTIDVMTGILLNYSHASLPISLSPDERYWVTSTGSYDTLTGKPLNKPYKMNDISQFVWSEQIDNFRLAVVIEQGEETGIYIYEGDEFLCKLDMKPGSLGDNYSFPDAHIFAFSPDGKRGAGLTVKGEVIIWGIDKEPFIEQSFPVNKGVCGILWGYKDIIIVIGKENLEFYQGNSGTIINSLDLGKAFAAYSALVPDMPSPLEIDDQDIGARFLKNPCFPLGHEDSASWIVAFETGLVVCPDSLRDDVSRELSYTLDNRFSWPWHWEKEQVVSSMASAVSHPWSPLSKNEALLFANTTVEQSLPNEKNILFDADETYTIEDFINLYYESIKSLDGGWKSHISDDLLELVQILTNKQNIKLALDTASRVPEESYMIAAYAYIAVLCAKQGLNDDATAALKEAENHLADAEIKEWYQTFVSSIIGAAYFLSGDKQKSKKYFLQAKNYLSNESNPFQKYWVLAKAYCLIEDYQSAKEIIWQGPWEKSIYSNNYLAEYIYTLIHADRLDEAKEVIKKWKEYWNLGNFTLANYIIEILLNKGLYEEAMDWLKYFGGISTDHYKKMIIRKMYENGKKEESIAIFKSIISTEENYPKNWIEWLYILAKLDTAAVQDYCKDIMAKWNTLVSSLENSQIIQLSELLTICSCEDFLWRVKDEVQDNGHVLAIVVGMAGISKNEHIKRESIDFIKRFIYEGDVSFELYLEIGKRAELWGDEILFKYAYDRAGGKVSIERIFQFQLEVDHLASSYQSIRRLRPDNRKYRLPDLIAACAKKKYTSAVMQLLMELPSKDFNDRPVSIMKSIRIMYTDSDYKIVSF